MGVLSRMCILSCEGVTVWHSSYGPKFLWLFRRSGRFSCSQFSLNVFSCGLCCRVAATKCTLSGCHLPCFVCEVIVSVHSCPQVGDEHVRHTFVRTTVFNGQHYLGYVIIGHGC